MNKLLNKKFPIRIIFKLWKKTLLGELKNGSALDIGCGYGFYSEIFKDYTGIDNNPDAILNAKKLYPEKHFEVMDATNLAFKNNKFDIIFSTLVLHHIEKDNLIKTAEEIKRVAKDNGQIYLIDMVLPQKLKFLAYPLFYYDKAITRTPDELKEILKQGGLIPKKERYQRFLNVGIVTLEF